jgi:hypothetical protein
LYFAHSAVHTDDRLWLPILSSITFLLRRNGLSKERSSVLKLSMRGCDLMFFLSNGHIRLTASELNGIRSANARQGHVVDQIRTRDELLAAVIDGLSPELVVDLLAFMRTGSTRLTQQDATLPYVARAGATSVEE